VNEQHESQLALIRALKDLGAVHVRVGDVEVRFDSILTPLPPLDDRPQDDTHKRLNALERQLGI
jgi:hypothetical protein